MDGIKKARIECCRRCPHRADRHADHAGPHGYSRFCLAPADGPIELHDEFMEGPDSSCPRDRWAGLEPMGPEDPAEWEDWNRRRNRERVRQKRKPELKQKLRRVEKSGKIPVDARTALAVLVAAGAVRGWLADEIEKEV